MVVRHSLLLTVLGPLLAATGDGGLLHLGFLRESYRYRTEVRALGRRLAASGGGPVPATAPAGGPAAAPDDGAAPAAAVELLEDPASFRALARQLGEYFCGERRQFDLPLDLRGSRFQRDVWERLLAIPYGQLRSYRQVARAVGRPDAVRAVGQAVGRNPVSLLVPCHRVIGSDGKLVGYAPGVALKAQLLRLEGHTLVDCDRIAAPRLF